MKVEETFESSCDNCSEYVYKLYTIYDDNGNIIIRLCKDCLMKLFEAILRR